MYVIPMSLLAMSPFCTTLYDAPYKFEKGLSSSVLSKCIFLFQIFFAFILFCDNIYIYS